MGSSTVDPTQPIAPHSLYLISPDHTRPTSAESAPIALCKWRQFVPYAALSCLVRLVLLLALMPVPLESDWAAPPSIVRRVLLMSKYHFVQYPLLLSTVYTCRSPDAVRPHNGYVTISGDFSRGILAHRRDHFLLVISITKCNHLVLSRPHVTMGPHSRVVSQSVIDSRTLTCLWQGVHPSSAGHLLDDARCIKLVRTVDRRTPTPRRI